MGCCKGDDQASKKEPRPHEQHFKGPIDKRSCTDIICCLIFVVFILGLLFVTGWAYVFGDIKKVVNPTNSKGELCGFSPNVKDRPFLIFFNIFVCAKMGAGVFVFGCPTKQVCVKKCPSQFWSRYTALESNRDDMICLDGKNGNDQPYKSMSINELLANQYCAEYVLPSIPVSGRCVPDLLKVIQILGGPKPMKDNETIIDGIKKYKKLFSVIEISGKVVDDISNSYKYIILGILLATVLSLGYVFLMRFFAGFMVWLSIALFLIIFIAASTICFLTYYFLTSTTSYDYSWLFTVKYSNEKFWLGFGIALSIILLIILLAIIFLRERIRIAIGILVMTSKSLVHMVALLFWPFVFFTLQLIVMAGCIVLTLQLTSIRKSVGVRDDLSNITQMNESSEVQEKLRELLESIPCTPGQNSSEEKICTFIKYGTDSYVYVFVAFTIFMMLWLIGFVKALSQMTIAGAFASYYFAFNKPKDIPTFPVFKSFWRSLRYHTGSLALGSFILAVVQFIRYIFEYLEEKARANNSIVAVYIAKCFSCCLWCLEKFIKFLNRNAYIMIAIYGQSFCVAAKNAFNLILRNAIRTIVVDKVVDFVLFIGKLVVTGFMGVLSFLFFNKIILKNTGPNLHYYFIPIIIIVLASYFISSIFLAVYEMGTDTIFLCFCEDLERNDGSPAKPYYMNKELMNILKKHNKKENIEMK